MGWYQRRVHGDFEAARSRPRTDDDATPHEAKAEKRTEPIDDDRATLSRKMPRTPAKKKPATKKKTVAKKKVAKKPKKVVKKPKKAAPKKKTAAKKKIVKKKK